jgi:hypothetical protein
MSSWSTTSSDARTVTPLVVKDKLIVGIAGGEFANRGFLDAHATSPTAAAVALLDHPRTGRAWRRHGWPMCSSAAAPTCDRHLRSR